MVHVFKEPTKQTPIPVVTLFEDGYYIISNSLYIIYYIRKLHLGHLY